MLTTKPGDFALLAENATAVSIKVISTGGAMTIRWGDGESEVLPSGVETPHVYAEAYTGEVKITFDNLGVRQPDFTSTITQVECTGNLAGNLSRIPKACVKISTTASRVRMGGTSLPTTLVDVQALAPAFSMRPDRVDRLVTILENNGQSSGVLKVASQLETKTLALLQSRGWTTDVVTPLLDSASGQAQWPYARNVNGTVRFIKDANAGSPRRSFPGRSLLLNGTTETCRSDVPLSTGDKSISVSFWANPSNTASSSDQAFCGEFTSQGGTGRKWLAYQNLKDFIVYLSGNGTSTNKKIYRSNNVLTQGVWQHLGFTYNQTGDALILYVNGVPVTATKTSDDAFASGLFSTAEEFSIGAYHGGSGTNISFYHGHMFNVRMWGRAITANEFARMGRMKPGNSDVGPTDAKLWLKLDEGGTSTRVFNSGSLGTVGACTITTSAIATVRNQTVNNVYSFQNELGHRPTATFNGSSDSVKCPLSTLITGYPFSMGGWLFATHANKTALSINQDNQSAVYWALQTLTTTGEIRVKRRNTTDVTTDTGVNLAANAWSHVAVEFADETSVKVFVNGVEQFQSSAQTAVPWESAVNAFSLGLTRHVSPADYWGGQLAGCFSRPGTLSAAQAAAIRDGDFTGCGQWYLDGQSGGNQLLDESGRGNHGPVSATLAGFWDASVPRDEATPTKDRTGSRLPLARQIPRDFLISSPCVTLNGVADKIDTHIVHNVSNLLTVSCWVNFTTSQTDRGIVSSWQGGGTESWRLGIFTGADRITFGCRVGAATFSVATTTAHNDGLWHFVVGTYDGVNVRLWVDGNLIGTTAAAGVLDTPSATTLIGSYGSPELNFAGRVSDVRIYNVAKSKAEIGEMFRGFVDRKGIIGHYPLTGGTDLRAYNTVGNTRPGTIAGTAAAIWLNRQEIYDTHVRHGVTVATRYNGDDGRSNLGVKDETDLSEFTITGWLRADAVSNSDWISAASGNATFTFGTQVNYRFQVNVDSGSESLHAGNVTTGRWVFFAGSAKTNGEIRIYEDAVLIASKSIATKSIAGLVTDRHLGGEATNKPLTGELTGIKLFDRELTVAELQLVMDGHNPATASILWHAISGGHDEASSFDSPNPVRVLVPKGARDPNYKDHPPINSGPGRLQQGQRLLLHQGESNSPWAKKIPSITQHVYQGVDQANQLFARADNSFDIYEAPMSAALATEVTKKYV